MTNVTLSLWIGGSSGGPLRLGWYLAWWSYLFDTSLSFGGCHGWKNRTGIENL